MLISDWSSDVCSSDLADGHHTCTHVVPSATNDARLSAASVVRADPPLSRTAIRLAPVDAAVRMTVTSMPRVAAGRFTLRAVVSGVLAKTINSRHVAAL